GGPAQLGGWSGNPFAASAMGPVAPKGISADAVVQAGRGLAPGEEDTPRGNPLGVPNTVMTQGYGVGSHAPANIWGAVDLAIDGNGDGQADPQGTAGTPVYATHDGVVQLARNTYLAGHHNWSTGNHFET